jgi:hypothetical protein
MKTFDRIKLSSDPQTCGVVLEIKQPIATVRLFHRVQGSRLVETEDREIKTAEIIHCTDAEFV